MSMSRIECESAILRKIKEIAEIYHQYAPEGDYLSMAIVNGTHLSIGNAIKDRDKYPIDSFIRLEEDENIATGYVWETDEDGKSHIKHYIEFDIRDASLVSE